MILKIPSLFVPAACNPAVITGLAPAPFRWNVMVLAAVPVAVIAYPPTGAVSAYAGVIPNTTAPAIP